MEFRGQHASGRRVLEPVENGSRDAKRRRDDAARVARMHALGQDLDAERSAGEAAQRRRRPEPLVVAAAGIEADHEVHGAHPRREQFEIGRQVVAAALLAGFDHADAARVRDALRLQRADGGQRCEQGVTVIGAAAPVELAVLQHRQPRAQTFAPARHFRLLVEVTVEQDRASARAGHVEVEHRRAAGQAHDLHGHAPHRLLACPGLGETNDLLDMAVFLPLRIEVRRFGRNADVLDELRDDRGIPGAGDGSGQSGRVHRFPFAD